MGLIFVHVAIAKMFKFPVVPMFVSVSPLSYFAGILELTLGPLLLIGLFTRLSAFILSGQMAFAYFLGHMFRETSKPVFFPLLNGGTSAILMCFACLYIAIAGGGAYCLDRFRRW